MPIYSPSADLKRFFNKYDKNGDGRLDKEELKQAFKHLGARFPAWRAARALKHADANRDGVISLEETNALIEYILRKGFLIK